MKLRVAVIAILCTGLFCGLQIAGNQTFAQAKKTAVKPAAVQAKKVAAKPAAAQAKITVLNPMGTPPPITLKPMAEPLNTLDGKTIYFVDTGYLGTNRLMSVMMDWFKEHYPKTNLVYKKSRGGMVGVDKDLWAEIGEKGDAAIIGLGH